MAIRMRNNTSDSICCNCGDKSDDVLNMFDICVADNMFTICDRCNRELLNKVLKAECLKNSRTKTSHDMLIIRRRANANFEMRRFERMTNAKPSFDKGETK